MPVTRILHAERVDYNKGKTLDLEFLLNQIGSVFKLKKEFRTTIPYNPVCKTQFKHRVSLVNDRNCPKRSQDTKPAQGESPSDIARLTQVIFDMKAEMGVILKAMI